LRRLRRRARRPHRVWRRGAHHRPLPRHRGRARRRRPRRRAHLPRRRDRPDRRRALVGALPSPRGREPARSLRRAAGLTVADLISHSPRRIISYNVRYFGPALRGLASTRRPKLGIAKALAQLDPLADAICLQEVETISIRSRIAFRRGHAEEPQLEAFMAALGDAFAEAGKPCPYKAFYFP